MKRKSLICVSFLLILWLPLVAPASEGRMTLDARINGRKICLVFDTGSAVSLTIWERTAESLSLKTRQEEGKRVATFALETAGGTWPEAKALVMNFLPFPEVDGVIGWPALRDAAWRVNWEQHCLQALTDVPREVLSWQVLNIDDRMPVAALPAEDEKGGLIYLDTGSPDGVALSNARWEKWTSEAPGGPETLSSGYMPAAGGLFVTEVRWAEQIQVGSLKVEEVLVEKNVYKWPRLDAVFGIEALKHFEMVMDLKAGKIYLKQRPYFGEEAEYNRLGAAFVPASVDSVKLVGHVLKESPAYRAGLRSGDILLKVDGIDMTQWRTDPSILKKKFWFAPAATEYMLEIERDGERHIIPVVLEEIFESTWPSIQ